MALFCGWRVVQCKSGSPAVRTVRHCMQFHVLMPWLNISVWGVFHMLFFNVCAWLALTSHIKGTKGLLPPRITHCAALTQ